MEEVAFGTNEPVVISRNGDFLANRQFVIYPKYIDSPEVKQILLTIGREASNILKRYLHDDRPPARLEYIH